MNIYLDESGDLGWKFDSPYKKGGSSRFLTLAFLFSPKDKIHLPKRVVKKLYKKFKFDPATEIKGKDLTVEQKIFFCKNVVTMLQKNNELKLLAITVNKVNVQLHLRQDGNKLYNYMVNLAILDEAKKFPVVTFIPDKRSIKVASGNSLSDYLQIKLWYEYNVLTTLKNCPAESHLNKNLQFTDIVSNCIWQKYENNENRFYSILKPHIVIKNLYF
jgi:hypothetical protein